MTQMIFAAHRAGVIARIAEMVRAQRDRESLMRASPELREDLGLTLADMRLIRG